MDEGREGTRARSVDEGCEGAELWNGDVECGGE